MEWFLDCAKFVSDSLGGAGIRNCDIFFKENSKNQIRHKNIASWLSAKNSRI